MNRHDRPAWVINLDDDDLQLIKQFVLASGSLKQLAAEYEVSYPTIRARVDALIERVRLLDRHADDDAFEAKVRLLVTTSDIQPSTAKELLRLHRQTKGVKT
jgi:hypothetical protein